MFLLRLIVTALRSLDANFLRSVLATLGVVIGVMAVISAMSIMEGSRREILGKFETLGSRVLLVLVGEKELEGRTSMAETLKLKDVDTLKAECDEIEMIVPVVYAVQVLKYFNKTAQISVKGTTHNAALLSGYKCSSGRFMSPEESRGENSKVVVLGNSAADKLFSGAEGVGRPIKIGNKGFRVIGVLEKQGAIGLEDVDDSAFIPIRTALRRVLRQKHLHRLAIRVRHADKVSECEKQIRGILRRAHKIRPGSKQDFRLLTQKQLLQTYNEIEAITAAVFYSIAGISLVVGGIGITNIMLVSVTERTREIGVRMAVGARRGDILFQFLVEALIISGVGGAGGILTGWMFAYGLKAILPGVIETYIPMKVVIWALAVAGFVGVASGIYPAYKASRKDPVEALRYE